MYKFRLSPRCLNFPRDSAVCHLISAFVTQTCSGVADGAPLSELSWPSSLAVVAVSFSGLFTFIFLMLACLCCRKGDIGFKVSSLLPPTGGDERSTLRGGPVSWAFSYSPHAEVRGAEELVFSLIIDFFFKYTKEHICVLIKRKEEGNVSLNVPKAHRLSIK